MGYAIVTLTIIGPDVDPDRITDVIGVQPSKSRHPCDPDWRRRLGDRAWEVGCWSLCRTDLPFDNVAPTIEEFTGLFARHHDDLRGETTETQISIGLFPSRGTGEAFYIEPDVLERMGRVGLAVWIDAYP